jgi:hypothetical protein
MVRKFGPQLLQHGFASLAAVVCEEDVVNSKPPGTKCGVCMSLFVLLQSDTCATLHAVVLTTCRLLHSVAVAMKVSCKLKAPVLD